MVVLEELDGLQDLITYKSWFDYTQPNRLNSPYTRHNPCDGFFILWTKNPAETTGMRYKNGNLMD